jgi:hypothetical protein
MDQVLHDLSIALVCAWLAFSSRESPLESDKIAKTLGSLGCNFKGSCAISCESRPPSSLECAHSLQKNNSKRVIEANRRFSLHFPTPTRPPGELVQGGQMSHPRCY